MVNKPVARADAALEALYRSLHTSTETKRDGASIKHPAPFNPIGDYLSGHESRPYWAKTDVSVAEIERIAQRTVELQQELTQLDDARVKDALKSLHVFVADLRGELEGALRVPDDFAHALSSLEATVNALQKSWYSSYINESIASVSSIPSATTQEALSPPKARSAGLRQQQPTRSASQRLEAFHNLLDQMTDTKHDGPEAPSWLGLFPPDNIGAHEVESIGQALRALTPALAEIDDGEVTDLFNDLRAKARSWSNRGNDVFKAAQDLLRVIDECQSDWQDSLAKRS